MNKILISIIIPCYNIESCVTETLFSLYINQNNNVEICIINDGSTDNTLGIINNTLLNFPIDNLKIINTKNLGLSQARNTGFKHVTGEYVWFLDGDDPIRKNAIKDLISEIQTYPGADIIAFQGYDFNDAEKVFGFEEENYKDDNPVFTPSYNRFLIDDKFKGLKKSKEYMIEAISNDCFLPSACFYIQKRDVLTKGGLRFIPDILFEDLPYTINLFLENNKILISSLRLILRRKRVGSITNSTLTQKKINSLCVVSSNLIRTYYAKGKINEIFGYSESIFKRTIRLARKNDLKLIINIIKYPHLILLVYKSSIIQNEIKKTIKNVFSI